MAQAKNSKRFTIADVGRSLFQSDACPDCLREDPAECEVAAAHILKSALGLRAMVEGPIEVDLGPAGILTITHRGK